MNSKILKIILFAPALFAGSCAVGPDFEYPRLEGVADSFEQIETPDVSGEASETFDESEIAEWWRMFNDPELDSLIERAFQKNYDIRSALSKIEEARAKLGMSESGLLPVLGVDADLTEWGSGASSSVLRYGAGAAASWEIDVFGGTRRLVESSGADFLSALFSGYAVKLEVAAEVAKAYFSYRANCELLAITEDNLAAQAESFKITEELVKGSLGSELDMVRAGAQLQTTQSEIPAIRKSIDSARYALELLLGLNVGELKGELEENKKLPEFEKIAPKSVPASLLKRRPDIIAAAYKIKSANANIGAAYADYLPRFYISGQISYTAPTSANLFDKNFGSWSLGPTVSWNLFNGGKTYYNVKYQKALTKTAGISWEKTAMSAIKEAQDNILSCAKIREQIGLLKGACESDEQAYRLSKELYESGSLRFLDLLEAQRTMLIAQQSLVRARFSLMESAINLYKSLGGGWNSTEISGDESPRTSQILLK